MTDRERIDEMALANIYGGEEVFKRRLQDGYVEAALGSGEWINDFMIVKIWAFFGKPGKVAVYEHSKTRSGGKTTYNPPFEAEYPTPEFENYLMANRIVVSSRKPLARLVAYWRC